MIFLFCLFFYFTFCSVIVSENSFDLLRFAHLSPGLYLQYSNNVSDMVEEFSSIMRDRYKITPKVITKEIPEMSYYVVGSMYDTSLPPKDCMYAMETTIFMPGDCSSLPSYCGSAGYYSTSSTWWGKQWGFCYSRLNCNDSDTMFKYCSYDPNYSQIYEPRRSLQIVPFTTRISTKVGSYFKSDYLVITYIRYVIINGKYCIYSSRCGFNGKVSNFANSFCYHYDTACTTCFNTLLEYQKFTSAVAVVNDKFPMIPHTHCHCVNNAFVQLYENLTACFSHSLAICFNNETMPELDNKMCTELEFVAVNAYTLIARSVLNVFFSIFREIWSVIFSTIKVVVFPWWNILWKSYYQIPTYLFHHTLFFEFLFIFVVIYYFQRDMYLTSFIILPIAVLFNYYFIVS